MNTEEIEGMGIPDMLEYLNDIGACSDRQVIRDFKTIDDAWNNLDPWYLKWWLACLGAKHYDVIEDVHYAIKDYCAGQSVGDPEDVANGAIGAVIRRIYPTWHSAVDGAVEQENLERLFSKLKSVSKVGRAAMERAREFDGAWAMLLDEEKNVLLHMFYQEACDVKPRVDPMYQNIECQVGRNPLSFDSFCVSCRTAAMVWAKELLRAKVMSETTYKTPEGMRQYLIHAIANVR